MNITTFNLSNRVAKELKFSTIDMDDIKRTEKQKARLENEGFNLKFTRSGLESCVMGYVKFNQ